MPTPDSASTVMSTTRITSSASYTVVGSGAEQGALSVVVLHRGRPAAGREQLLARLEALGASEVISVERGRRPLDVESLAATHQHLRFLLVGDGGEGETSPGTAINIAVNEARSRNVLVVWSDVDVTKLPTGITSGATNIGLDAVTVPYARSERREVMPTLSAPAHIKRRLRIILTPPDVDGNPSLYPFDYVGIYDRPCFLQLGGFDTEIGSEYWQRLDFGLRCFLWGQRISLDRGFVVDYRLEPEPEDTTPRDGYRRFFLKNLAVRRTNDRARLSWRRLATFLLNTDGGLWSGIKTFRNIQQWVETHRYDFQMDASGIAELWEV